jgi:aminoglycoside phosphotransferase (APT) family kinase protein
MTATATETLRPPPSAEALTWVVEAVGAGAEVVATVPLPGSSSVALHALAIRQASGMVVELVLRQFLELTWLTREPDLAAREARALTSLAGSPVPAPELVAVDASGARAGAPAVLMTRLPGAVDVAPVDPLSWVRRLAAVLPPIHETAVAEGDRRPYWRYASEVEPHVPAWSRRPDAWARALEIAAEPGPTVADRFIHRDFHPGNVLWRSGRVSGIVDWVDAAWGPREVDVAHCRVNLAMLFGLEIAERFASAVAAEAGERLADPYWNAVMAVDMGMWDAPTVGPWLASARPDLTADVLIDRFDAFVAAAVAAHG